MLNAQSILWDRYVIGQLLDQSGFGDLYLAHDRRSNQPVTVKAIVRAAPDIDSQFERDVAILASLGLGAVPTVVEHFTSADGRYLVSAHVGSTSLSDYVAAQPQRRLDDAAAIRLLLPVVDVLVQIHSRTPPFLHRDIRPANIRLSPEGNVFLVNFGIASLGDRRLGGASYGVITPGFSPPEQSLGGADPRADLYALGATLYMLLGGTAPPPALERVNYDQLLPISSYNPAVSPQLQAVTMRLLALNRDGRYPDAAALRRDLLRLQGAQICPRCDTPNRGDARFCRTCGEGLPGTRQPITASMPASAATVLADGQTVTDPPLTPRVLITEPQPQLPAPTTEPVAQVQERVVVPPITAPVYPAQADAPVQHSAAPAPPPRWPLLAGVGATIVVLLLLLFGLWKVVQSNNESASAATTTAQLEATASAASLEETADARASATARIEATSAGRTATAEARASATAELQLAAEQTATAREARTATAQIVRTIAAETVVSMIQTATAAVPTPTPTPALMVPAPGTLGLADYDALVKQYRQVVFETFDRRTTLGQWPDYNNDQGAAELRDSLYRLTLKQPNITRTTYWPQQRMGNNYNVELDVAFQTTNAPMSVGIAFDVQEGEQLSGVVFEIVNDKHWYVATFVNGQFIRERTTGSIPEGALVDGNGTNRLWVVRMPDQVQLWINSTHVGTIPAGPFDGGFAGVARSSFSGLSSPATVIADNFRLRVR